MNKYTDSQPFITEKYKVWEDFNKLIYVQGADNISEVNTAIFNYMLHVNNIDPADPEWYDDEWLENKLFYDGPLVFDEGVDCWYVDDSRGPGVHTYVIDWFGDFS